MSVPGVKTPVLQNRHRMRNVSISVFGDLGGYKICSRTWRFQNLYLLKHKNKMASEPSESQLGLSWHDSAWIPVLNSGNVLEYFSQRTNPFYDRTCNNEVVKMQRLDSSTLQWVFFSWCTYQCQVTHGEWTQRAFLWVAILHQGAALHKKTLTYHFQVLIVNGVMMTPKRRLPCSYRSFASR